MTWCAGDTRVATVSVCEFDTFEGVVVLLSAGLLTALCLLHLRSSLKSGGRKAHGPATAAYAAAVAALLSSHVAILTSLAVAGHRHDAPAAWTLMPARLFLHSAALALYALLALLILIGWCQRIPVPYTRPVATCVAAFYVSRVALDVPQNSAGHLPAALLVASCLQCLASLALAILAAVTYAPAPPPRPCRSAPYVTCLYRRTALGSTCSMLQSGGRGCTQGTALSPSAMLITRLVRHHAAASTHRSHIAAALCAAHGAGRQRAAWRHRCWET